MVGEMGKGGQSHKKKELEFPVEGQNPSARWLVLGPILPAPPGCVSHPTAALMRDP